MPDVLSKYTLYPGFKCEFLDTASTIPVVFLSETAPLFLFRIIPESDVLKSSFCILTNTMA